MLGQHLHHGVADVRRSHKNDAVDVHFVLQRKEGNISLKLHQLLSDGLIPVAFGVGGGKLPQHDHVGDGCFLCGLVANRHQVGGVQRRSLYQQVRLKVHLVNAFEFAPARFVGKLKVACDAAQIGSRDVASGSGLRPFEGPAQMLGVQIKAAHQHRLDVNLKQVSERTKVAKLQARAARGF
jgi:hypothetical protein